MRTKRNFDDTFTFVRGTTGTYIDEGGLIRTAGVGEPRFTYDPVTKESLGLLIEPSATNYCLESGNLTVSPWTPVDSQVTEDSSVIAPDGVSPSYKLESTTGSSFTVYQLVTMTQGTVYNWSGYAKAGSSDRLRIYVYHGPGDADDITYDLSTGTITPGSYSKFPDSAKLEDMGNGWFRCSVAVRNDTDSTSTIQFRLENEGESIYLWGGQLTEGNDLTSYIPTTSSAATRNRDEIGRIATPNEFNTSGTVFTTFKLGDIANDFSYQIFLNDDNSTSTPWIGAAFFTNSTLRLRNSFDGDLVVYSPTDEEYDSEMKLAISYDDAGNFAIAINGNYFTATGTVFSLNQPYYVKIGRSAGVNHTSMTKEFRYWPKKLTQTEMENLTSV